MKNLLSQQGAEFGNSLPQPAKIVIFLIILGIIFTFWRIILWSPLQSKNSDLQIKKQTVTKEIAVSQKNIKELQNTFAKFQQAAQGQKVSEQQPIVAGPSPQKISQTLKALLTTSNLTLISLDALPGNITIDPDTKREIFEHNIVIKFSGGYFATLAYIEAIEKLNWPIYWDNLTYVVTKYPEANVQLNIHTISIQEESNYGTTNPTPKIEPNKPSTINNSSSKPTGK